MKKKILYQNDQDLLNLLSQDFKILKYKTMITFYKGFSIEANKLENQFVSAILRDKDGNLIKADTLKNVLPCMVFNLKLLVDKITKPQQSNIAA